MGQYDIIVEQPGMPLLVLRYSGKGSSMVFDKVHWCFIKVPPIVIIIMGEVVPVKNKL